MGQYDARQVCNHGHQITDLYYSKPETRLNACSQCGSFTFHRCPQCLAEIRGRYLVDDHNYIESEPLPHLCHNCNAPYPWMNMADEEYDEIPNSPISLFAVRRCCNRFHLIASQLSRNKLIPEIPQDTMEVILFINALLAGHFPADKNLIIRANNMVYLLAEDITVFAERVTREMLPAEISTFMKHALDVDKHSKATVYFLYDPENIIGSKEIIESEYTLQRRDGTSIELIINPTKS